VEPAARRLWIEHAHFDHVRLQRCGSRGTTVTRFGSHSIRSSDSARSSGNASRTNTSRCSRAAETGGWPPGTRNARRTEADGKLPPQGKRIEGFLERHVDDEAQRIAERIG